MFPARCHFPHHAADLQRGYGMSLLTVFALFASFSPLPIQVVEDGASLTEIGELCNESSLACACLFYSTSVVFRKVACLDAK